MNESATGDTVQTVTGVIDSGSLGVTLPHEHILFDMSTWAVEPEEAGLRHIAHLPLTLENLHIIRADRRYHADNMRQTDERLAIDELLLFKMAGGATVVDVSQHGLSRDPVGLARISRATGLNIVMGCGYYVAEAHPPHVSDLSDRELADEMIRDIKTGVGDTGIRSGIIGEIGCSVPLHDEERKVLRAAAMAQQATGAPLIVHPSFDDDLVMENIEVLKDAGADLSHTIISHVDQNDFAAETCRKILACGCYLEFDAFGHLGYPHLEQGKLLNLTGDIDRVRTIKRWVREGFVERVLISGDICFKDCLTAYGGYGYGHIPANVMPLMKHAGLSPRDVETIVIENPKRVLPFRRV